MSASFSFSTKVTLIYLAVGRERNRRRSPLRDPRRIIRRSRRRSRRRIMAQTSRRRRRWHQQRSQRRPQRRRWQIRPARASSSRWSSAQSAHARRSSRSASVRRPKPWRSSPVLSSPAGYRSSWLLCYRLHARPVSRPSSWPVCFYGWDTSTAPSTPWFTLCSRQNFGRHSKGCCAVVPGDFADNGFNSFATWRAIQWGRDMREICTYTYTFANDVFLGVVWYLDAQKSKYYSAGWILTLGYSYI